MIQPKKKFNTPVKVLSIILILNCVQISQSKAMYRCPPCTNCDQSETDCYYGDTINFCGRRECFKGPNESCGGFLQFKGQCVEGTTCVSNRCQGCFIDVVVECSE